MSTHTMTFFLPFFQRSLAAPVKEHHTFLLWSMIKKSFDTIKCTTNDICDKV